VDARRPAGSETGRGAAFPRLFSPLAIGPVTLRNRIVSSGHDTVMAEGGLVSDRLVAYQEARALGGVGLIVIQVAGVHPTARYTSHELTADDDACVPGFRRLAETAHANGSAIFGQLFHGGREIMDTEDGTLAAALAPSPVPTERFHVMPRAMPVALIDEIIAGFGASAARLEAAGLDGVEVVASHGYLPSQFLNPRTNLRSDAYGGDAERRGHGGPRARPGPGSRRRAADRARGRGRERCPIRGPGGGRRAVAAHDRGGRARGPSGGRRDLNQPPGATADRRECGRTAVLGWPQPAVRSHG
jgi:hypothetical protein